MNEKHLDISGMGTQCSRVPALVTVPCFLLINESRLVVVGHNKLRQEDDELTANLGYIAILYQNKKNAETGMGYNCSCHTTMSAPN